MKLKLIIASLLFPLAALQAQSYTIDAESSVLRWTGEKVTGKHYGTIGMESGTFAIENNMLTKGSFTVDMNSIVCEDLENETYNSKLIGHLKSDDFFSVEKFPTSTFEITGSSKIAAGKADVPGNLTVKGITKPVTFRAVLAETENTIRIYGNVVVDRTDFDVRYGSGSFFDNLGDKTIYDEFTVKLEVTANKS
jgi:polyisoprenoid-binding protein YceI